MKRAHRYLALGAAAAIGCGVLYATRPGDGRPRHGVRIAYALDLEPAIAERTAALGRPPTAAELQALRHDAQRQTVAALRARLDARGLDRPAVFARGAEIVVELAALDDEALEAARALIVRTASLAFVMVADGDPVMGALFRRVGAAGSAGDPDARGRGIEAQVDTWTSPRTGQQHVDYYLSAPDREEAVPLAEARALGCGARAPTADGSVRCPLTGRQVLERYLAAVVAVDPTLQPTAEFRIGYERLASPPDGAALPRWRTYYLERAVRLDDRAIAGARVTHRPETGQPEVEIELTRAGAEQFGDLTAAEVGRKLAIVMDDRIVMAPVINDAIRGGRIVVSLGTGTAEQLAAEAQALVGALRAGALPAPLREESVSRWGPAGADP